MHIHADIHTCIHTYYIRTCVHRYVHRWAQSRPGKRLGNWSIGHFEASDCAAVQPGCSPNGLGLDGFDLCLSLLGLWLWRYLFAAFLLFSLPTLAVFVFECYARLPGQPLFVAAALSPGELTGSPLRSAFSRKHPGWSTLELPKEVQRKHNKQAQTPTLSHKALLKGCR